MRGVAKYRTGSIVIAVGRRNDYRDTARHATRDAKDKVVLTRHVIKVSEILKYPSLVFSHEPNRKKGSVFVQIAYNGSNLRPSVSIAVENNLSVEFVHVNKEDTTRIEQSGIEG